MISMRTLSVTNPSQIRSLLDLIHDWYFDVEKILHDQVSNTITILLAENTKNLLEFKNNVELMIFNVKKIEIRDTEKVGYYDINKIIYNDSSKVLKITCGIPLGIKIFTDGLRIEAKGASLLLP